MRVVPVPAPTSAGCCDSMTEAGLGMCIGFPRCRCGEDICGDVMISMLVMPETRGLGVVSLSCRGVEKSTIAGDTKVSPSCFDILQTVEKRVRIPAILFCWKPSFRAFSFRIFKKQANNGGIAAGPRA